MFGIDGSRGFVVVIVLCLYIFALGLVFSKFKLVRWGWLSGTISVLIGAFILATFLALFNYLTPAGRVTVTGKVVEVGDRALQFRTAMSFIVEKEIIIVGMFSQNGFETVKIGAPVDIVFDNAPGRIYHAKISVIPQGVGQGQVAVSGTLARTNALGGATAFPA